jgi:hypothetical protein
METTIDVERLDMMDFMVTVVDGSGPTQHTVVASQRDHQTFAPDAEIEDLVAETFRFLLERQPHSMINEHFSLEDVARLFIDYEFEMKRRFAA